MNDDPIKRDRRALAGTSYDPMLKETTMKTIETTKDGHLTAYIDDEHPDVVFIAPSTFDLNDLDERAVAVASTHEEVDELTAMLHKLVQRVEDEKTRERVNLHTSGRLDKK